MLPAQAGREDALLDTVSPWGCEAPPTGRRTMVGAGATLGRASQRPSKGRSRAADSKPQGLHFATSVTHARWKVSHPA